MCSAQFFSNLIVLPGAVRDRVWSHGSDTVPARLRFPQRNWGPTLPQLRPLPVHVLIVLREDVQEESEKQRCSEKGAFRCAAQSQAAGAESEEGSEEWPRRLHGRF